MIELSADDRASVDGAARQLVAASGSRLLGLALYGEAASVEYHPGRSPLALVALVGEVDAELLQALRPAVAHGRKRGIPTPLVVDSDYLERARDVFPLELLELRDRHAGLAGDATALGRIVIDTASLRRQVDAELRGKALHLWEGYLTKLSRRRVRRLLEKTVPYFLHLLRGMLELRQANPKDSIAAVVHTVEREYGVELPVLAKFEHQYHANERIPLARVHDDFAAYLTEARSLVRVADRS